MKSSTRVIFNTLILYFKVILSLLIALISVPLILKALGASDYGLFNLVAGIIAMLSFLNNSMTVSTQRFMSVAIGENDCGKINVIYNTGFLLHLILGIVIIIIFESVGVFAIEKLNIQPERQECALVLYQFLILSTFFKIISVPFDALINAKEDMLTFSIIELLDSVLMLAVAFSINYFRGDKLVYYGSCVTIIQLLTFIIKYWWCKKTYADFRIKLKTYKGRFLIKEMLGFTTWNLFGGLAIIGRNQGAAVIINMFFGTISNAAYGIANQVNGAIGHFSATFQKAINPQLMKSEGMNNRDRLIKLSFISSKFSVLAIAFFAIPIIIELDTILKIWLGNSVPPNTHKLTQYILVLSIIYQYSVGLMSSIQATGNIRNYQTTIGTILLLNIPFAFVIFELGYPVYYITISFIIIEIISLFVRLYFAKHVVGVNIRDFLMQVLCPTILNMIFPLLLSLIWFFVINQGYLRLCLVFSTYTILFVITMWKTCFDERQKIYFRSKLGAFSNRMRSFIIHSK